MPEQRFAGRIAIATGSTQGVGEALLHQLADEGLSGAVVTGRNHHRGASVCAALAAKGCETVFVECDLSNADDVAALSEAADDRRRAVDEQPRPAVEVFEASDKGHGRVETRTVSLCRDLSWITTPERWPGLSFVAQIVRERTILATGTTSTEAAYDIGSGADATAATASSAIRGHWGIENQLHWVLDLAFREDEARHRAKNTAQNMTTLRHFALNIVKQDPDRKLGVANSRKRAGWDRDYLIKLMTTADR